MASSAKESQPKGNPPATNTSWASIAANKTNTSLPLSNTQGMKTYRTCVWHSAYYPGTVIFDMSKVSPTHLQVYEALFEQYPKRLGATSQKEGKKTIFEVGFAPDDYESISRACKKGLYFKKAKVTVVGVLALEPKVNIRKVSLSRLPLRDPQTVIDSIRDTMVYYGQVLDAGVLYNTTYCTYMGAGYVILDVAPCTDSEGDLITFEQLQHNIPWLQEEMAIHAVTSTLPKWCHYCHKDGHKRDTCPICPTNNCTCWLCQETGHSKANCPCGNACSTKTHKHQPSMEVNPEVQATAVVNTEEERDDLMEGQMIPESPKEAPEPQVVTAVFAVEEEEEELPSPGHDHTIAEQVKQVKEQPQMETPATKRQKTKELFPRVTRSASSATTKPTTHIPGVQAKPASTPAIPSAGTTPATTLTS